MTVFKLCSPFAMQGDQKQAVEKLIYGLTKKQKKEQMLLGVTGSGKTFTMANVIQRYGRPVLIMVHNKTLAAQLYNEMKSFFPRNAVEYFVSYYDYYQPESYIPQTSTYIEKDAQINEQIDLLRHSATRSLLERKDVIVVASISCIYGLGAPDLYLQMSCTLVLSQKLQRKKFIEDLINLQYKRTDFDFHRGSFRVRGSSIDIFPSHHEDIGWRISFFDDKIEKIYEFYVLTGQKGKNLSKVTVFANSHYVTPRPTLKKATRLIKQELTQRVTYYQKQKMLVEAERISQRTNFDLEMILESGSCKGIENYSRYLSGKKAGEAPPTLFEYLPKNALLLVDESHVTVPQISGMFNGDRARKTTLVEHGFRLPSALDNRPLKYEEWLAMRPQTIFISATPGEKELNYCDNNYVEQVIRPTGLLDPVCEIRPCIYQVDDLVDECKAMAKKGSRVLVTTLTKKMAEHLTEYLKEIELKAVYMHSDIKTFDRIRIIQEMREGKHDVLVGINLLREGLDIPECVLVAILDADKEGFLRSETSLIQTIGRAARNSKGRVILYADKKTKSITNAINKTRKRRKLQDEHNKAHGIIPKTITKTLENNLQGSIQKISYKKVKTTKHQEDNVKELHKQMLKAAENLDFELATKLRDKVKSMDESVL